MLVSSLSNSNTLSVYLVDFKKLPLPPNLFNLFSIAIFFILSIKELLNDKYLSYNLKYLSFQ